MLDISITLVLHQRLCTLKGGYIVVRAESNMVAHPDLGVCLASH